MTNNDFYEIYKEYQRRHMSHGTCISRRSHIEHRLLPTYGELKPADITNADLNRIYDEMESSGLADNTIFGAYAAFLSYFKLAAEYGEVAENPASLTISVHPAIERRRKNSKRH